MNDRRLPPAILTGFVVAILAIVTIGVLGYRSLRLQGTTARQVSRTLEVRTESEALLVAMVDAETGQRGFLLTGEESYLGPYERGRAEAPPHLASLRRLTSDNPGQQTRVALLETYMNEKLAELARTVELRRRGDTEAALAYLHTGQSKSTMEQFRAVMAELERTEQQLLDERTAGWESSTHFSFAVVVGGAAILLLLVVGAFYITSRDFRARSILSWLKTGQSELAGATAGNPSAARLVENALAFLGKYLDARVGAAYLSDEDGTLRRAAGYAFAGRAGEGRDVIERAQGLVGQVAAENRVIELSDVPPDYLRVSSAVGERAPLCVIIAPTRFEEHVNGVVELGTFHRLRPQDRELLELVSGQLGLAIRSAQDRERVAALLEETQRQAEELQTQQEELRVSNEELEEQGRALKESHARLENQQAELEQTNAQLEAQAATLEQQKTALQHAQLALTERAVELERASTYKSEFLANMSHELRTPLNSSLILAKLLADNKDGNLTAEQVQFAETIHASGTDLLDLINDILDLSKIEAGKAEVRPAPLTIVRLVDGLKRTFDPIANEKGLSFDIHVEADAPTAAETDQQRLQQILKNLLSNAFKFTDRGEVSLRISADGSDRFRIAVSDSGIGIAPHQLKLIFEPFRQADGASTRKYSGTGLGLSISRDLARLLGGDLTVESTLGSGSTFTLTLPRKLAATPSPPARPELPSAVAKPRPAARVLDAVATVPNDHAIASTSGERSLLVIEDDPVFAKIVADLGHEHGYQSLVAGTADEGVELALCHAPTAIVLDIGLPDHSGLTVLDRLKRNPSTRHIPVHVVSSFDYTQAALEMGAMGYMLKPVKRDQLEDALERIESRTAQRIKRVLVVEDDDVQRTSIARLLGNDGVEIVGVGRAADALAELEKSTYDCMVIDLKLPDASGFEVLERIASEDAYSFPPVIVYTGRELSADDEQRLRRYSHSIIIKDARSPERLLDEVTLFLHQVESQLPPERQRMLKEARNREATFDGRRILVVEDDVRNIFALSRVFEPKGAKIEIARNGREALSALEKHERIDLVLMDIMMPEMDGYEAMREIRKRGRWSGLPIIAHTAKAMHDDQEKCLRAGANDYIAKPLDVEKLLSLARVWMPR